MEWLETFFQTTSLLKLFHQFAAMSATDVVLIFLLSKPVFLFTAVIATTISMLGRREEAAALGYDGQYEPSASEFASEERVRDACLLGRDADRCACRALGSKLQEASPFDEEEFEVYGVSRGRGEE